MGAKVFISAGSHPTPQQAAAIEVMFQTLLDAGLDARQMDRNEWSYKQPLHAIRNVIDECHGLVLVAFTRFEIKSGIEHKTTGDLDLVGTKMTTVWNQIEAAMAYVRGMPFLVIAENGLRDDGLIEARYDWNVYWTDFSPEDFRSRKFRGWVDAWAKDVAHRAASASSRQPTEDLAGLSVRDLLRLLFRMKVSDLWTLVCAVAGLIAAIATAFYRIGGGKWPWQAHS